MTSKLTTIHMKFFSEFNKEWDKFLKSFNSKLSDAQQLHIGNHMRPQLVFWGYMLKNNIYTHYNFTEIAKLAVSVEAIHKASVIIDDIIDSDAMRRGEPCMHKVYGEYQTVFFAVCMLAQGISQLVEGLSHNHLKIQSDLILVLCETIRSMCMGAIREISASTEQQVDLSYVQEIIDSETAQLIKNSLYMGFIANNTQDTKVGDMLCTIGAKCGYVFQVMNDLEPFCNPKFIEKYKGSINTDILRSRKSIVLPYLFQACSSRDKTYLLDLLKAQDSNNIITLFNKYEVKERITKELECIQMSIFTSLKGIEELGYESWAQAFAVFVNHLHKKYTLVLYS